MTEAWPTMLAKPGESDLILADGEIEVLDATAWITTLLLVLAGRPGEQFLDRRQRATLRSTVIAGLEVQDTGKRDQATYQRFRWLNPAS